MKSWIVGFVLIVPCLVADYSLFAQEKKEESLIYETRQLCGWTLHLREDLLAADPKGVESALKLLEKQLQEIINVVPKKAVGQLQKVPLWFSPEYAGVQPKAEYHPGKGWLEEHGRDPSMAKGVEFTNVRIFESECRRMPNFALHELSHAYHDQFLPEGFGNREIIKAYDRAKAGGKYERVEQHLSDGSKVTARAYALTTPMEYFAENTEAYFSTNDFYPFNREELKEQDEEMLGLLGQMWESK